MKNTFKYFIATLTVFFMKAYGLFAQNAESALNAGVTALKQNASRFITVAMILTGISGAISIAWALIDRKNAQEGANQKLMTTGISLLAAFIFFVIIQMILQNIGVTNTQ